MYNTNNNSIVTLETTSDINKTSIEQQILNELKKTDEEIFDFEIISRLFKENKFSMEFYSQALNLACQSQHVNLELINLICKDLDLM